MLTEINPLIVTPDGEVRALDSKFTVDDSALFRHPDIAEMRDVEAADPHERLAREKGVTYVKLDGEVGILGNGAGLSMSTVDVVVVAGGRPANFCDLGGGGDAQGVVDALEVITSDDQVRSIFFNIFGGITRCDEVARGILAALEQMKIELPIVVRLDGTNAEEGRRHPRRRRAAEPLRRADDARGGAARGGAGGMTDVWSQRADAFRESPTHREGPDLDLLVEWCEPGPDVKVLDVATGGGHVAQAAARARAARSSPSTRPRACSPMSSRARKTCRSRTGASTSSPAGSPRTTFEDIRKAVAEMARVTQRLVVIEDNVFVDERVEEAERLRDPTHVRCYSRGRVEGDADRAGLEVEQLEHFERHPVVEDWLARVETPPADAARVRELLADHVRRRRARR